MLSSQLGTFALATSFGYTPRYNGPPANVVNGSVTLPYYTNTVVAVNTFGTASNEAI